MIMTISGLQLRNRQRITVELNLSLEPDPLSPSLVLIFICRVCIVPHFPTANIKLLAYPPLIEAEPPELLVIFGKSVSPKPAQEEKHNLLLV